MSFSVISTFSGCGGSSLGYKLAGGKVLLAVEVDDHAVECYKANFPNTPIYHGDIGKLSVEEALKITSLRPGELDIFDGSPPCQGFSTIGKRNFMDERNQLFREYCRLLKGLKPKTFIMENVSGMIKGKMKILFAEILRELKACGYNVSVALLNAANYGVPQARKRVIFIGVREDLGITPTFPKGSTRVVSVEEALKGVQNKTFLEPNPKYVPWMNLLRPGQNLSKHKNGSHFSNVRAHRDKPSSTLTKTIAFGKISLWHYSESRNITIEEAKRLQSFPDDFILTGSYEDQWARIGNSVPPLLMKAISGHVDTQILKRLQSESSMLEK